VLYDFISIQVYQNWQNTVLIMFLKSELLRTLTG